MPSQDPTPDASEFKTMRRRILRALSRAVESAIGAFYSDVDLTVQIRNGKCIKLDMREIENLSQV